MNIKSSSWRTKFQGSITSSVWWKNRLRTWWFWSITKTAKTDIIQHNLENSFRNIRKEVAKCLVSSCRLSKDCLLSRNKRLKELWPVTMAEERTRIIWRIMILLKSSKRTMPSRTICFNLCKVGSPAEGKLKTPMAKVSSKTLVPILRKTKIKKQHQMCNKRHQMSCQILLTKTLRIFLATSHTAKITSPCPFQWMAWGTS